MTKTVVVVGGVEDLARSAVAAAASAGFAPLVVDVQEPTYSVDHVYADIADERIADVLAAHGPLVGVILCPVTWSDASRLLDRWVKNLLLAAEPSSVFIGIAPVAAVETDAASGQARSATDHEVVRQLELLDREPHTLPVRPCLLLHGPLVPMFEDCRGEMHEMPSTDSELERSQVETALSFALSRPLDVSIRRLVVTAAPPLAMSSRLDGRHAANTSSVRP